MNHQRSNLSLVCNIIVDGRRNINSILNFSSNKFLKLYLNSYLTDSVWVKYLIITEAYFNFLDCIGKFLTL